MVTLLLPGSDRTGRLFTRFLPLLDPALGAKVVNDLMRVAKVEALVTKSISGHLTDRMREHYSTVTGIEQRESIGRVLRLVKPEPVPGGGAPGGARTPPSGAPGEEGAA